VSINAKVSGREMRRRMLVHDHATGEALAALEKNAVFDRALIAEVNRRLDALLTRGLLERMRWLLIGR
jgi:hypothetical protein